MAGITTSNEAQIAAMLNMFEYLDYHQGVPGQDLRTLVEDAEQYLKNNPGQMTESRERMISILKEGLDNIPGLADLRLAMSEHGGAIEADAFVSDSNDAYVAYRGTGDGKWIDNGRGMTQEITASQQSASDFYDRFAETFGLTEDTNLIITGHSKGGNNAQAATLNAENRTLIDQCFSFDGQGFSDEAIERYSNMPGYEDQREKIYGIHGENDPVNELGIAVIPDENTFYIETNADSNELAATHALEYLFQREDGSFGCTLNEMTEQGTLGRYFERLSEIIMSMPPETRDSCAVMIMQLIEFGEEMKIGFDGDHASFTDASVFIHEGLPAIIYSLIETEEGRDAIAEILKDYLEDYLKSHSGWEVAGDITMILALAPIVMNYVLPAAAVIMSAAVIVIDVLAAIEQLKEVLVQIGAYIQECLEAVAEFFEEIGEWVRSKITGRPIIKNGDFSVDISAMHNASEELGSMQRRLSQAGAGVNQVRRSLSMYGIAASVAKAYLDYVCICVYQTAGRTGTMQQAVNNIAGTYERYERRITDNALAL